MDNKGGLYLFINLFSIVLYRCWNQYVIFTEYPYIAVLKTLVNGHITDSNVLCFSEMPGPYSHI